MKHWALFLVLAFLGFLVGKVAAKDNQSQFKQVQVKHFTLADGVGLSQNFIKYFDDGLRAQLQKENLARLVADETATVPAADAPDSIVVEGEFTCFVKARGFHLGRLCVEIKLYRTSDHQLIKTLTPEISLGPDKEKHLANFNGEYVGKEIRKTAKDLPALASFPPGPPLQATTPSAAAPVSQTPPPNADVLTNSSVLEMVTAKLPEEVIITKIQVSPTNFDVSTPALAELNQRGVSPAIIKAMLIAPKVAPAPVQPPVTAGADVHDPGTPGQQHFSIAEGVSLPAQINPQNYLKLFADELRTQLQKRNIPVQVAADGAGAPETDAAGSPVVECRITDVSKGDGSLARPVMITVESNLYRRGNHTLIKTATSRVKAIGGPHGRGTPLYDDKTLASWTAAWVLGDIKKVLK